MLVFSPFAHETLANTLNLEFFFLQGSRKRKNGVSVAKYNGINYNYIFINNLWICSAIS